MSCNIAQLLIKNKLTH